MSTPMHTRMMPCKACCPNGGKVRHERGFHRVSHSLRINAFACGNCGNVIIPAYAHAVLGPDAPVEVLTRSQIKKIITETTKGARS